VLYKVVELASSFSDLLSTFELTIQNTTIPQVRNLFSAIAVFISFSPWRAAAVAVAAAALAVRNRRPWP
jgi:hypothetical protein